MVGLLALWFYLKITLFGSKGSIDNEHAECEIRTIKEERIGTRRGSGAREEKRFVFFMSRPSPISINSHIFANVLAWDLNTR